MKNILIVGCGAIAQAHHIPVLKKLKCNLYLCDTNPEVIPKKLNNIPFSTNYNDFINNVEGALICTSHASHFSIANDLLEKNINVLIEKPITVSLSDCEKLVKFEKRNIVAAGYFRRYIENFRLLKEIIETKKLGVVNSISINEGGVYGWPVMSNSFWKLESAGGGVLIDTGSHSVDLVNYLFNGDLKLINYTDDSKGGVEANSDLYLLAGEAKINISLSRNRPMSNSILINFSNGFLELDVTNGALLKTNISSVQSFKDGEYPDDIFTKQATAWINDKKDEVINASDVLKTVMIINQCYEKNYVD